MNQHSYEPTDEGRLSNEEMIELAIDSALGRPSRLQTRAAIKFRAAQDAFTEEMMSDPEENNPQG